MCKEKKERVRVTLLLDDETLKALKAYSYEHIGETNMSKAVMLMAKEQWTNKQQTDGKIRAGS